MAEKIVTTRSESLQPVDRPGDAPEIALVGDLHDREADLFEKFLEVEPGGPCTVYFDSDGGSAYVGLALMGLIRYRRLHATGIVLGSCMSAALLPFAACQRRLVFAHSAFLFHPMRWESGENVQLSEATEWARHFGQLESEMDDLLAGLFGIDRAVIDRWNQTGRYMNGRDLAEAGVAELIDLRESPWQMHRRAQRTRTKRSRR